MNDQLITGTSVKITSPRVAIFSARAIASKCSLRSAASTSASMASSSQVASIQVVKLGIFHLLRMVS